VRVLLFSRQTHWRSPGLAFGIEPVVRLGRETRPARAHEGSLRAEGSAETARIAALVLSSENRRGCRAARVGWSLMVGACSLFRERSRPSSRTAAHDAHGAAAAGPKVRRVSTLDQMNKKPSTNSHAFFAMFLFSFSF